MTRANPNPIFHVCGRPTRTLEYSHLGPRGEKIGSRWVASCSNTQCSNSGAEGAIEGEGETMTEARWNYRVEYKKLQGGE